MWTMRLMMGEGRYYIFLPLPGHDQQFENHVLSLFLRDSWQIVLHKSYMKCYIKWSSLVYNFSSFLSHGAHFVVCRAFWSLMELVLPDYSPRNNSAMYNKYICSNLKRISVDHLHYWCQWHFAEIRLACLVLHTSRT